MHIPNLKRVKIDSDQDLRACLAQQTESTEDFMVVTVAKRSSAKHVGSAHIQEAALRQGWHPGPAYTLNGGLRGQVFRRGRP
jgi:hypothetical protein